MKKTQEFHTTDGGLLPFDPIVLLLDVAKRWLLVVLAAVMVGVGSYIYTDMSYTPTYQTNVVFVVTNRGSSTTVYNNLSSTSNVATLFTELLNSSIMRKTIMQELEVSSLDAQISTSVIANTNLVNVRVSSSDPRTAFLVAQVLIDRHESLTYTIVDGIVMEVLQHPSVPSAPINRADAGGKMKKMGVLAAAAAAFAIAAFSYMRDTVRSSTEVQQKLDCDYLGEIPHERKYKTLSAQVRRRKTSILMDNPITSFRYVESIRKLRRRVEQMMDGGKVVMVTSLLENEGKSTVSVNLAIALAKKHSSVLLIDCDLRKPACHAILETKKFGPGIKELLQEKATLAESVLQYKNSNMYVLYARKAEQNIGDMIASDRMATLLDWARKNFDYVVLDLPPVAVASDAEGMAGLADATILVCRQNVATAGALNKVIASLDNQHAKLLGCVLNNTHSSGLTSNSGYGYGYGYGYGAYRRYDNYGSKRSGK